MLLKIILIFITIIIIIMLSFLYIKLKNSDVEKICDLLYNKGDNKKIEIIKNVLSYNYCKDIIKISEDYANIYGWKKKRHDNYPTVDNEITKDWVIYNDILQIINNNIFDNISKLYNIDKKKLGINEIFVVKYEIGGQTELDFHEDGSEFSFVISLNNDFSGGGTYFKYNEKTINLNIGDCLIFSGQNTHKANAINSGIRYILTGFINYGGKICDNFIKNN